MDHILCNNKEKICQSGTVPIGLSDHFLTYCTRKISKGQINKHKYAKIRSLKKYTKEEFILKLTCADWSQCFYACDINTAWSAFRDIFLSILNTVAPVKEVRLKQRTEPWINSEILDLIKQRDHYLYQFKKSKDSAIYKLYCQLRNKVQREIKEAKSEYFSNKIEENKNCPRKLWQQLKDLGYKNKKNESSNLVLTIDDQNCHDPKTIADYFNDFFTTIAEKLVQKLPLGKKHFDFNSVLLKNFYDNSEREVFYLKHVSEEFVFKELSQLNSYKSTGLDEIPARFLKDGASLLKIPVTFLLNMSISENSVPDALKIARVKPLYKKNSNLDVGNYRPVSILSIVSKILEKAIYIQLEEYLVKNNIIYDYQSGFRSSFSTDTCLIHLLDHIKMKNAKGLYTGMILLDLQKAFDTVDHNILCNKLKLMGIGSTKWFESYLSNRSQLVNVGEINSDTAAVTCGVPQGSILGPLLFLCYVNDMVISIDPECKLLLYADDSTILFSHRDPAQIANKLGKVLESCSDWLVDNKLSLHLGKTECILFGSKRKLKKVNNFHVQCYDHKIEPTQSVKYLGLNIDNLLSGELVVNNILSKVNARLKFMYRHSNSLSQRTRKNLCSALILCHFDYSCSSWYDGLSKGLKKKLQIAQNKVVRFINSLGPRTRITGDILAELNLLNVETRVKQLRLNHVHKIFYNLCPTYLKQNFVPLNSVHQYNTRSSGNNFLVPHCRSVENSTFYYRGITDWNSLPDWLKELEKPHRFKSALKQYLIELHQETEIGDFFFY